MLHKVELDGSLHLKSVTMHKREIEVTMLTAAIYFLKTNEVTEYQQPSVKNQSIDPNQSRIKSG